MQKLIITALVYSLILGSINAQIKRQYRDTDYAQTEVVIKDNTELSDIDILNTQLNMDDYSMHDVIRITTELDRVVLKPETEVPVEEPTNVPSQSSAEIPTSPEAVPVSEAPFTHEAEENQATSIVNNVSNIPPSPQQQKADDEQLNVHPTNTVVEQRSNTSVSRASSGSSASKIKKKRKKKRFTLKKKRRVKRNRYRKCYAF